MPIGGDRFLSYVRWIYKKKIQVWLRTYLSHALAIVLAFLAFLREMPELKHIYQYIVHAFNGNRPEMSRMYQSGDVGLFTILVLVVIVATLFAAFWEIKGNKLTTSPQEVRFVTTMRLLLQELEKFIYG